MMATDRCRCPEAFEIQEVYPLVRHTGLNLGRMLYQLSQHFRQPDICQRIINICSKDAFYLDVSIPIVANLHKVLASCGQFRIYRHHPALMRCQVPCSNTECVSGRAVYIRLEEHVVDLSVEIDTAVASV